LKIAVALNVISIAERMPPAISFREARCIVRHPSHCEKDKACLPKQNDAAKALQNARKVAILWVIAENPATMFHGSANADMSDHVQLVTHPAETHMSGLCVLDVRAPLSIRQWR